MRVQPNAANDAEVTYMFHEIENMTLLKTYAIERIGCGMILTTRLSFPPTHIGHCFRETLAREVIITTHEVV